MGLEQKRERVYTEHRDVQENEAMLSDTVMADMCHTCELKCMQYTELLGTSWKPRDLGHKYISIISPLVLTNAPHKCKQAIRNKRNEVGWVI